MLVQLAGVSLHRERMLMVSVKWNGKEIQNPVLRATTAALVIGLNTLMVVVLIVLSPLLLLGHLLLRAAGLRGFAYEDPKGSLHIDISGNAFSSSRV